MGVEVEPSTRPLQPHLAHTKSHAFLRHAPPLLPLAMPSPASKYRRVVAPYPVTWTRPKTHRCSLPTPGRQPVGRPRQWPWTKNQSGCVDASASASEIGAERGDARVSGGLVIGRPPPRASLVIAKGTRSEIGIGIVSGIVLGSENETGIGLLDVVVDTAVKAVLAAVAGAGAWAEAVDTVEATATATGHWPREWDSNVFSHNRPYMNSRPFMDQSQHSVSGTDPLILTMHTIVALADASFFDWPMPGYVVCINFPCCRNVVECVYFYTICVRAFSMFIPQHVSAPLSAFLRNRTRCDILWALRGLQRVPTRNISLPRGVARLP